MLNNSHSRTLRVFSLDPNACREFGEGEFGTLAHFHGRLSEWFGIAEADQLLLKDGQPVTLPPTAPFALLQLHSQTSLLLTAKQKGEKGEKGEKGKAVPKKDPSTQMRVMATLCRLQDNVEMARERERLRLLKAETDKKMLYCASKKAIDALLTHFIRRLKLPNGQALLTDRPKLGFILAKIARGNPRLLELLRSRAKSVKAALVDLSLRGHKIRLESSVVERQVRDLTGLGYPEERAIKALEMGRNSMERAIELLQHGGVDQEAEPRRKLSPAEEYLRVVEWLSREKTAEIALLHNCPSYLWVYLNSIKHSSPQVFELMRRWHACLPQVLSRLYAETAPQFQ